MSSYFFSCNGICNGPVRVEATNVNYAKSYAEAECGGECIYLGCEPRGLCDIGADVTEGQRNFIATDELKKSARLIEAPGWVLSVSLAEVAPANDVTYFIYYMGRYDGQPNDQIIFGVSPQRTVPDAASHVSRALGVPVNKVHIWGLSWNRYPMKAADGLVVIPV
ncbi:hypothetical protein [Mesorhizobium sp. B1-1-7]|uniref:hypothetical protein n=1 Tax=Mesorhizobium sp. B1-1-7 TaxID=2589977 RepID=UPI00112B9EE8|nr:hypothetical protein [Mesorhizobium sp. B1-1-7]TPN48559.1 hypothetical protein FJ978_19490 [Mesorhizobium sp. B1-1-7]